MVNVITKSGGNLFTGSLRATLTNDSWSSETPLTTEQTDEINTRYEATFGGRLIRDKLWFFLAARDRGVSQSAQLVDPSLTPYESTDDERRFELKLTGSPHQSHQIVFTHRIVPGGADRSYGIHVGQMAGLPAPVTRPEASSNSSRIKSGSGIKGPFFFKPMTTSSRAPK